MAGYSLRGMSAFKVRVHTVGMLLDEVDLYPTATALDLKRCIQTKHGVHPWHQRLLRGDVMLKNDAVLGGSDQPVDVTLVKLELPQEKDQVFALQKAVRRGSADEVELLLQVHENIDLDSELTHPSRGTALCAAASSGHVDVARQLVKFGADKDKLSNILPNNPTALCCAVSCGHREVTRFLCDAGADKNKSMDSGETALVLAARRGDVEMVRLLCNAGADVNHAARERPLLVALHSLRLLRARGTEWLTFNELGSLWKPVVTAWWTRLLLIGVFIFCIPHFGLAGAAVTKAIGAVMTIICSLALFVLFLFSSRRHPVSRRFMLSCLLAFLFFAVPSRHVGRMTTRAILVVRGAHDFCSMLQQARAVVIKCNRGQHFMHLGNGSGRQHQHQRQQQHSGSNSSQPLVEHMVQHPVVFFRYYEHGQSLSGLLLK